MDEEQVTYPLLELELSSLTVQFKVQAFGLQFQFKRLSFKLKKFYSYIPN
jgi:hypothetical protein